MQTKEDHLNWGIVGCSNVARHRWIEGINTSAAAAVTAIASRNLNKAKTWASELAIPKAYGSYQQMLDDPDIDAVFIGLPLENVRLRRTSVRLWRTTFKDNERSPDRVRHPLSALKWNSGSAYCTFRPEPAIMLRPSRPRIRSVLAPLPLRFARQSGATGQHGLKARVVSARIAPDSPLLPEGSALPPAPAHAD